MGSAARIRAILALFLPSPWLAQSIGLLASRRTRWFLQEGWSSPGGGLTCGGTQTLLRDFEGFAVSSTVIMLNVQALNPLPQKVQWLIYYQGCGDMLFGPSETSADCYAVRRARREGWLDEQALDDICAVFNIAGHGPVHPDPEERCNQLRQCFVKKGGVTAGDGGR